MSGNPNTLQLVTLEGLSDDSNNINYQNYADVDALLKDTPRKDWWLQGVKIANKSGDFNWQDKNWWDRYSSDEWKKMSDEEVLQHVADHAYNFAFYVLGLKLAGYDLNSNGGDYDGTFDGWIHGALSIYGHRAAEILRRNGVNNSIFLFDPVILLKTWDYERPFVFTDNTGNLYISGYDSDIGGDKPGDNPSRTMDTMLHSGVFFGDAALNTIKAHTLYQRRRKDHDWKIGSALSYACNIAETIQRKRDEGKSKYPYVFVLTSQHITTAGDIWKVIEIGLGATLLIALTVISGGTLSPLETGLLGSLASVVDKFVKTGSLNLGDVAQASLSLAPTLIGDKDSLINKGINLIGSSGKDIVKYAQIGNQLYSALATYDHTTVANTLGLPPSSTASINTILKDLEQSDTYNLHIKTQMPIVEADKVMLSMQNSEMVRSLTQDYEAIEGLSLASKNSIQFPAVQQLMLNAQNAPKLLSGIPNSSNVVRTMLENQELTPNEYGAFLLALQGEQPPISSFDDLALEAMKERAKKYKGGHTFVLPSTVPPDLQAYYKTEIEKQTGVKVIIPFAETVKDFKIEFP